MQKSQEASGQILVFCAKVCKHCQFPCHTIHSNRVADCHKSQAWRIYQCRHNTSTDKFHRINLSLHQNKSCFTTWNCSSKAKQDQNILIWHFYFCPHSTSKFLSNLNLGQSLLTRNSSGCERTKIPAGCSSSWIPVCCCYIVGCSFSTFLHCAFSQSRLSVELNSSLLRWQKIPPQLREADRLHGIMRRKMGDFHAAFTGDLSPLPGIAGLPELAECGYIFPTQNGCHSWQRVDIPFPRIAEVTSWSAYIKGIFPDTDEENVPIKKLKREIMDLWEDERMTWHCRDLSRCWYDRGSTV